MLYKGFILVKLKINIFN